MKLSAFLTRPGVRLLIGVLASAVLSGLYARGGVAWVLGFVAFVPWLRALDANRSVVGALLGGWLMSVAFTAAAFAWFGSAIGHYAKLGPATGIVVLLVLAPLFQPQFIVFVLVRHITRRWQGPVLGALAGVAAWVATEAWVPKILGDSFGYGLYPSQLLRQAADVGGTAGLTVLLLLANEALTAALARRTQGLRALARPLALAALVPLLLVGYGFYALSALPAATGKPLRMALVQSNIIEYDRLRAEKGGDVVVREVLDTHFAMTYDAVERQRADAVLWTETVYPLTFGHPKSEAGAELDREILETINAAQVPFVFGTYDVDEAGEYNAAAFVTPGKGLLGRYRKTRLFPFTEYVPAWLDGPWLRQMLPWAGAWQPGTGARVFPLQLKDGREIPVMPLICLDDVDTTLAIDGTRLGAQAIVTMSNDSWFTHDSLGAEMHHTAAAFRSIETRLPQYRVTPNGHSAIIDRTGEVIAGSRMGERTLVIGELPVGEPKPTLMVTWGDWVGQVATAFLVMLVVVAVLRRWSPRTELSQAAADAAALPAKVVVLPLLARWVVGLLRLFARGSLLWMAGAFVLGVLTSNTLAQIRLFTGFFLVPELAAWLVLQGFAARASLEPGLLVLMRGRRRLELPLQGLSVSVWRLPIPGPGASLRLASGERHALVHADPLALARVLNAGGEGTSWAERFAQVRAAIRRGRLDRPLMKFGLLPLLLAVPAFRLHQIITFGDTFGEYHAYGLVVYLLGFALWWAGWIFGVALTAAVLRALTEVGTLLAVWVRPAWAFVTRLWLERLGLAMLYLGIPAWLLMRVVGS